MIEACDRTAEKKPRRSGAFYGQGLPEDQLPVGLLSVISMLHEPVDPQLEFGEFVMLK